jgi:hypothetical protein
VDRKFYFPHTHLSLLRERGKVKGSWKISKGEKGIG